MQQENEGCLGLLFGLFAAGTVSAVASTANALDVLAIASISLPM